MIDAPGIEQKDVNLVLTAQVCLVVHTGRSTDAPGGRVFQVRERRSGMFVRQIALPPDGYTTAMTAALKKGILTVTIPRKPLSDIPLDSFITF